MGKRRSYGYIPTEHSSFYEPSQSYSRGYTTYYGSSRSGYTNFDYTSWLTNYQPEMYPESKLSTQKPLTYEVPSKKEIFNKLRQHKLYSSLTNETFVVDASRFFYHQLTGDQKVFKPSMDLSTEQKRRKLLIEKYYQAHKEKFQTGSPFTKAITLLKCALENSKNDPDVEICCDNFEKDGVNTIAAEVYFDPTFKELLDHRAIPDLWLNDVYKNLSLMQNFGHQFSVEKEVQEKLTSNSEVTKTMLMREYSQLHLLQMYQTLLPTYKAKLAVKDLIINAKLEKKEVKQKIIIILDYSGSMDEEIKQKWVATLMLNRLKEVMEGNAEIYFSYFLSSYGFLNFTHCYDRQTALALWKNFCFNPDGGGTRVGDMIQYIHQELEQNRLHNIKSVDFHDRKPEILVINDGNDKVHSKQFPHKTNAVTLLNDNLELKELCLETHGKYIHINESGKVIM